MSLKLGDLAPTFTAETTDGAIEFHQWLGNRWGVLFSHPKDFTQCVQPNWASWPRFTLSSSDAACA